MYLSTPVLACLPLRTVPEPSISFRACVTLPSSPDPTRPHLYASILACVTSPCRIVPCLVALAARCLPCLNHPLLARPELSLPLHPLHACRNIPRPTPLVHSFRILACPTVPRPALSSPPCLALHAYHSSPAKPCLLNRTRTFPVNPLQSATSHICHTCVSSRNPNVSLPSTPARPCHLTSTYSISNNPKPIPADCFESGRPSPIPTCIPTREIKFTISTSVNMPAS